MERAARSFEVARPISIGFWAADGGTCFPNACLSGFQKLGMVVLSTSSTVLSRCQMDSLIDRKVHNPESSGLLVIYRQETVAGQYCSLTSPRGLLCRSWKGVSCWRQGCQPLGRHELELASAGVAMNEPKRWGQLLYREWITGEL